MLQKQDSSISKKYMYIKIQDKYIYLTLPPTYLYFSFLI